MPNFSYSKLGRQNSYYLPVKNSTIPFRKKRVRELKKRIEK